MVYKFFDKKSKESGINNEPNYQLANELHKPIIRKFKKRKVYSSFRDHIWGVDLADMQSLNKSNKGIKYFLCAIDMCSKHAWVVPITLKSIQHTMKENDVLDDIVNKYNNAVHRTIKMKPIDVTDDSYTECNKDANKKNPNFKVGDYVRISKYKNIFAKGYTPNWSEEVFIISKIKNTVSWTYVINDLNCGEITGSFYEKELQKTNQKKFRIDKVLKRKGDKLYVKWKGYNDSFNSWIDKKDLV